MCTDPQLQDMSDDELRSLARRVNGEVNRRRRATIPGRLLEILGTMQLDGAPVRTDQVTRMVYEAGSYSDGVYFDETYYEVTMVSEDDYTEVFECGEFVVPNVNADHQMRALLGELTEVMRDDVGADQVHPDSYLVISYPDLAIAMTRGDAPLED